MSATPAPSPDAAGSGPAASVPAATPPRDRLGTATIAVMAGAFGGLSPAEVPHASSMTRIVQFVGGSFGAAVLVAVILDRQVEAHAGAGAAGLAAAFGHTFWWTVGFTALAAVPALLLAGRARLATRP
jgi:hypothetical protein